VKTVTIISTLSLCSHSICLPQELNTILMESTFKIVGKTKVDTLASVGTVFFIVRPYTDTARQGRVMLVTAAHVLEAIAADNRDVFSERRWGLTPMSILRHFSKSGTMGNHSGCTTTIHRLTSLP